MHSLHCCNFTAGLIQCWAPEVTYPVRQYSQLLGQLSRQVRVPFRADKLETPAVVMCRVCSDSMLNLTSYDSTHSPLASRNMFSSVVWAPFPPHVYYKWKSIFPACAGTYLREQSYQKTFWYFSVFPGEWMAHEQNMVVKTRLQKRFYLKSCIFLIQWRLNSLKNYICDWSLLTYTHTQIYSNRFIFFFYHFLCVSVMVKPGF